MPISRFGGSTGLISLLQVVTLWTKSAAHIWRFDRSWIQLLWSSATCCRDSWSSTGSSRTADICRSNCYRITREEGYFVPVQLACVSFVLFHAFPRSQIRAWKKLLFGLAFFHACIQVSLCKSRFIWSVLLCLTKILRLTKFELKISELNLLYCQERRKYGAIGWNIRWSHSRVLLFIKPCNFKFIRHFKLVNKSGPCKWLTLNEQLWMESVRHFDSNVKRSNVSGRAGRGFAFESHIDRHAVISYNAGTLWNTLLCGWSSQLWWSCYRLYGSGTYFNHLSSTHSILHMYMTT